jgi:hypothetical protein
MSKIPGMQSNSLKGNNDLLSRLSTFLPELAAANKKLNETEGGSNSAQIDISLQKDDDSADGSVSSDVSGGKCSADGKQTIQMTVQLKSLDDPIMTLLSNDDNNNEEYMNNKPSDIDAMDRDDSQENRTVKSLLGESNDSAEKEAVPLFTVRSTRRKNGSS